MLSKLYVLKVYRISLNPVRTLGGLTPLEKFEKLRELCCKSFLTKKIDEEHEKFRPRIPDPATVNPCADICDIRKEYLNVRCKNALILGGASGIGYETADNLLTLGAKKVIVADINQATGKEAVKKLCSAYGKGKATFMMTDLQEQQSVETTFRDFYKRYNQLDIYVNTVGMYNEKPQCWDQMIKLNLIGCVRGTLIAYKYMSNNPPDECGLPQDSVIINVSSYGPIADVPSMPFFSAASNGIIGLTTSLGQDFYYAKSKVRFVTICPSCTDSNVLKNMSKNHFDSQWAGFSNSAMKCCTKQSAKFVGKAIANAARYGKNGSIYVAKEGKYYKYEMPDYVKIMRQETVLW